MRRLITCLKLAVLVSVLFFSPIVLSLTLGDWYLEPGIELTAASQFDESEFTEQRSIIKLKAEYEGPYFQIRFDGESRYDSAFDSNPRYSGAAIDEYRHKNWIDEATISVLLGDWNISAGRQKIAWGEGDDIQLIDIASPLDFQDFVLLDIDRYRISQDMLRIEGFLSDDWELDAFWTVESKTHEFPVPVSEFSAQEESDLPVSEKPSENEFGFRASSTIGVTDISFYGFYGYEDQPIYELEQAIVKETYARQKMLAFSYSRPLLDWIVRGEFAAFPDQTIGTDTFISEQRDVIGALLGLDYVYLDWILGFQWNDRYIDDYNENLFLPERNTLVTASLEGTTLAAKLTSRVAFSSSLIDGGGYLSQLKLTYRPNRFWSMKLNIDIFSGDENNIFGQYNSSDRFLISIAYTIQ